MPSRRCLLAHALVLLLLCVEASAHEGWGIVVDARGRIFLADIPTNTVWVLTPDGELRPAAAKHSHELVLGRDGSVYLSDEHRPGAPGGVFRITPDGRLEEVMRSPESSPLSLHPFAIDANGNVYSTNAINSPDYTREEHVLLKAAPDGSVSPVAGGPRGHRDGPGAEARFLQIDGMAWGTDGALLVTDGPYVRRVGADGTVSTVAPGALTEARWDEDLMGLRVGEDGALDVADYSGARVVRLSPDGRVATLLVSGWPWSPTGVTAADGTLYVLEHLRMPLVLLGNVQVGPYMRVRSVAPDGTVRAVRTVWGRHTPTAAVAAAGLAALVVLAWRRLRRRGSG